VTPEKNVPVGDVGARLAVDQVDRACSQEDQDDANCTHRADLAWVVRVPVAQSRGQSQHLARKEDARETSPEHHDQTSPSHDIAHVRHPSNPAVTAPLAHDHPRLLLLAR
jgi:hypothetical protein